MAEPAPAEADTLPCFLSAEAIAHHPRFGDAVSLLVDRLAELYGNDRRLVRELFEYDRAVTFMLAVCIAMGEREDDPASWLTLARLAEGAALMGIGPVRRIRRFVEEMRADGHLLETAMPGDRRRHRLRPTERMLAVDRQWLAAFHAPLALLVPDEPRYRAAVAEDPDYHRRYRTASMSTLAVARATMVEHPAVDSFLHQAGGVRILATLLRSGRGKDGGWSDPGFFALAAERSATTRVHVSTLLRAAMAAGHVEIDDSAARRVRATPAMVADFDAWTADSLSATDLVSALAQRL